MPDGLVQWFDPESGEGRVLHRRRRYAVRTGDIETAARVPGARVHFDIDHESGGTRATDVTLRRGTRSVKRKTRFGDLTGASTHEGKKPPTTGHEEFDLDPEIYRNPVRAAEYWAGQLSIGDLDEVMVLYSPTASLHNGSEVRVGFDEIRRHWQPSSLLGGPPPSSITGGEDNTIVVRWPRIDGGRAAESRLRIARGEIIEQWQDMVPATEAPAEETVPVELSVEGEVSQRHRDRAMDRIGKVLSRIDAPVLHARIRLVNNIEPARDRPAVARVMLDVNGEPVRASVATDDLDGAIDSLEERLRQQLESMASHREALMRRGVSSPAGEWRHGDLSGRRPSHYPRPVEERQVVQHKTFTTERATVDEAIFDMETMDYDFFLFTCLATGQEAFVHRRPGGTYGLQVQDGHVEATLAGAAAAAVEVESDPARSLSVEEAREYLDVGPAPWVFFTDADGGRGRVLYRRYDGHYGLITPR